MCLDFRWMFWPPFSKQCGFNATCDHSFFDPIRYQWARLASILRLLAGMASGSGQEYVRRLRADGLSEDEIYNIMKIAGYKRGRISEKMAATQASIFRDTDTISSLFARRQVSLLHAVSLLVFIERALVGAGGLQVCIWYCILERDWTVAVLKLHSCQWDIWLCCQVLLSDVSWLSMNVLAALF